MENDTLILKKYELSYMLPVKMTEEEISVFNQKIVDKVVSKNGMIEEKFEAKKIRLSYPIKRNENAYFCVLYFSMMQEKIKELEKELKSSEEILRYMVLWHKNKFPKKWEGSIEKMFKDNIAYEQKKEVFKKIKEPQDKIAPQEKKEEVNVEELNKKLEELLE